MGRGSVVFLRIGGPHRILLPTLVGLTAVLTDAAPALAVTTEHTLYLLLIALCASAALALLRAWFVETDARSAVRSSLTLAAASTAATAATALSLVEGLWAPPLFLLAAAGVIVAGRGGLVLDARMLPAELEAALVEGLLAPLLGMTLVAGSIGPSIGMVVITVPLAIASTASVYTHEGLRELSGLNSIGRWPATVPAIPALLSLMIAAMLLGVPAGFHAEQSLLVVAPASLAVFVSWLVLADPRPEWRVRRVRMLSLAAIVALEVSLVVVLVAF